MKVSKLFKNLQLKNILNFPVLLFTGILIVAIASILGSRYIRGQGDDQITAVYSSDKCNKLGVNGGSFAGEEVYQEMGESGFAWYQGLVAEPSPQKIIKAINAADTYGIKIIVRICWGTYSNWNCEGFNPKGGNAVTAANNYVNMLREVADNVNTDFYAIAGHNEPNAQEHVPVSDEREFMETVINAGLDTSKIHLLSPIMDLHAEHSQEYPNAQSFGNYLGWLNQNGYLQKLAGIAGNAYEMTASGQHLTDRYNALKNWMNSHGLSSTPIFITETGPYFIDDFSDFKSSYITILEDDQLSAALFFKPDGLADSADHMNWDQAQEISSELGCSNSDGTVVSCAFTESDYLMKECSSSDSWGVCRGLILEETVHSYDNPQWQGEGEWIVKIDNLPTMNFYASNSIQGTGDNDTLPYGGNHSRINPEKFYLNGEIQYLDLDNKCEGFGLVRGEGGGILFKPQYKKGEGSLIFVTDFPDPSSPFKVAAQLLDSEEEHETMKKNKTLADKTQDLGIDSKHWSKTIFDWIQSTKCSKSKYEFSQVYDGDATSGYWTKVDNIVYEYDLARVIKDSNLMDTIGQSCNKEAGETGVPCKIATNLKGCNSCWEVYDPVNPYNVIGHECTNLKWKGGGEILPGRKEALIRCIYFNSPLYVRHCTQNAEGLELSVNQILEGAWKSQAMLADEDTRICNPNIGITLEATSRLVDVNWDCGGGGAEGCENNLVKNATFSWGMRRPKETSKQEWGGTPVYWYPYWNPSPPGSGELSVLSPEIEAVTDGIGDDRGSDGNYVKIFSPQYAQTYDGGIFQEIWFGDADGNPISDPIPAGTPIIITANGQGNNGYVGHENSDYTVTEDFVLKVGISYDKMKDSLAASGPDNENFRMGSFPGQNRTATQSHKGSKPPGFTTISFGEEYKTTQDAYAITIFIGGTQTVANSTSPNKLQSFWDQVCVTLPTLPDIQNISPADQAESFPWSGIETAGGYCSPDPESTNVCPVRGYHPQAEKTIRLQYPLIATGIDILRATSTEDYALFISELELCPEGDVKNITETCLCRDDQYDPLTEYLYDAGIIDTDMEEAFAKRELGLASNLPYDSDGDDEEEFPEDLVGTCGPDIMPLLLPFEGTEKVVQGWYNDNGSHHSIPAIDFSSDRGRFRVLASRGGVIAGMKKDSTKGGVNVPCTDSNFVSIYHEDYDLYSHYVHLQYGSIPDDLEIGQRVRVGQFLGYTGNTGCSTAIHLHFGVTDICGSPDYCWNNHHIGNYCFVEYPDMNWVRIQSGYLTSQNKEYNK